MTVEEERLFNLQRALQKAEEDNFPAGKETLTKEEVLTLLGDHYASSLKKEYELFRLCSFVCSSGNFERYVQYCKDTRGTLAIDYANVIQTASESSVKADEDILQKAKEELQRARRELARLKGEGKIVS